MDMKMEIVKSKNDPAIFNVAFTTSDHHHVGVYAGEKNARAAAERAEEKIWRDENLRRIDAPSDVSRFCGEKMETLLNEEFSDRPHRCAGQTRAEVRKRILAGWILLAKLGAGYYWRVDAHQAAVRAMSAAERAAYYEWAGNQADELAWANNLNDEREWIYEEDEDEENIT